MSDMLHFVLGGSGRNFESSTSLHKYYGYGFMILCLGCFDLKRLKELYLLKVHLQTFLSIPITQKCQILSCDTLVANE